MSMFLPNTNPLSEAFRDYSPGPHPGVEPGAPVAAGSIDPRARNALILGVCSVLFGALTGVPAIWVGRRALSHVDAADGALKGRWAAWTGIALGCLSVAITIAVWSYLHDHGA